MKKSIEEVTKSQVHFNQILHLISCLTVVVSHSVNFGAEASNLISLLTFSRGTLDLMLKQGKKNSEEEDEIREEFQKLLDASTFSRQHYNESCAALIVSGKPPGEEHYFLVYYHYYLWNWEEAQKVAYRKLHPQDLETDEKKRKPLGFLMCLFHLIGFHENVFFASLSKANQDEVLYWFFGKDKRGIRGYRSPTDKEYPMEDFEEEAALALKKLAKKR